jgi:hypothetical protein
MKEYAMWQEEMGYVEYDNYRDDYIATSKHPGDSAMLNEYMNRNKGVSVVRVKEVKNDGNLSDGQIKQVLWKVNGTYLVSSSSRHGVDGKIGVNETMFFLATGNGTITSHADLHVMYPAEFDETKIAIELHRWANEEMKQWTGDDNAEV